MEELIAKLNEATKAYDEGHPIMPDSDWDKLYFQLLNLERETGIIYPNSPTQTISYDIVNELPKVEHNHKMLSLDKTKDEREVDTFLGNHDFVAMAKLDGLTCSLHYIDGRLVSAETRGNGIIGEDVTHNAKVISSIPKEIGYKEELVIDGEIICMWNDFQSFITNYKNPRNFAAGSIRLLDAKECSKRKLTFIAWDVIKGINSNSFVEKLETIQKLGFHIVPWIQENPTYAINDMKEYCEEHGYPIDGIVFKFNDVAYGESLGETGHHFKNAIAYKFCDDLYDTTLLDIEWSMGRTGVLTPVAIFKPVDIDGSIVERASLHNINVMTDILGHNPHKGQPIKVAKMNMIIPQIISAEEKNARGVLFYLEHPIYTVPEVCPICGSPTECRVSDTGVAEVYCANPSCNGKLVNRLDHFLGKKGLDVKGISYATLEKLVDWGWVNELIDIYSLAQYAESWKKKVGFGEKSVNNILNSIELSKNVTLDKFICALGIPLIGTSMSKTLAKTFKTWDNFRQAIKSNYHFWELDDFGYITTEAIMNFDYREADGLAKIFTISYEDTRIEEKKLTLSDKKICITGSLVHFKNRAELQAVIEGAGGKVVSSVTKNTDILINNNATSTSAKNIAAKKLGVVILTEEDFLKSFID